MRKKLEAFYKAGESNAIISPFGHTANKSNANNVCIPLGQRVSETSSIGMTNFGGDAALAEKKKVGAAAVMAETGNRCCWRRKGIMLSFVDDRRPGIKKWLFHSSTTMIVRVKGITKRTVISLGSRECIKLGNYYLLILSTIEPTTKGLAYC